MKDGNGLTIVPKGECGYCYGAKLAPDTACGHCRRKHEKARTIGLLGSNIELTLTVFAEAGLRVGDRMTVVLDRADGRVVGDLTVKNIAR